MLIDEFMPVFDFSEKHETKVSASAEKVYAAIDSTDFNDSARQIALNRERPALPFRCLLGTAVARMALGVVSVLRRQTLF